MIRLYILSPNLQKSTVESCGIQSPESVESVSPNLQESTVESAGIQSPESVESVNPNLQESTVESAGIQLRGCVESLSNSLQECIHFYKEQVLRSPRSTDVMSAPKTSLDNFYVNLVIHSERAPHNFSEKMRRHEIYAVYMKVPEKSIRLKEVKDLFYPNEDTKGKKSPKTILVVGRPGIGKTVLTEKIMHDWAGTVDKCYDEKIAFHFKFRWFNGNNRNDINLKTFLRYGTGLSDEKFDQIYEYIITHSEKAILIFDGLDEFNGNSECLNDLPPLGNRDSSMSWISLFLELIFRHHEFLPEATILVTSRPTADEFYSRFSFDRTVEIIGLTSNKIKQYVQKLCVNNGRRDLKRKIWEYINSISDILNLCYIPVNCWIVSTILFECFKDSESKYASVPNTLTDLYQEAITHLDKHHFRKCDGQIRAKAIKELQSLAFKGIEHGQLVFSSEIFDEQMRKSGLLNKLSNPFSQAQQQFCFIHLTIQEFLAAKHITETFNPEEINEFVTSHFKSGKWHLVLQFIAGLLGKKITKFFQPHYSDCLLAFAKCIIVRSGKLELTDDISLRVIKCLREVDDGNLIKKCTEATAMNDVVDLSYDLDNCSLKPLPMALSDWDAVALVCKHMKNFMSLELRVFNIDVGQNVDVTKLLQQRCIKKLKIQNLIKNPFLVNIKGAISALLKLSCKMDHEHSKLTEVNFSSLHDKTWLDFFINFFKEGRAHDLEKLVLEDCFSLSPDATMSLFKVLTNEHCPKLTYLDLNRNLFSHKDVRVLCGQRLFNLAQLYLERCALQEECIPSICELLTDERCNLTLLSLQFNRDFMTSESLGMKFS